MDPAAFGQLIREAGGRRTQRAAATCLGISQQHYSKLCRGSIPSITKSTYEKLLHFIPIPHHARLARAVLGPAAQQILRAYNAWLARALSPFGAELYGAVNEIIDPEQFHRAGLSISSDVDDTEWQACIEVLDELWRHRVYRSHLHGFFKDLRGKGWLGPDSVDAGYPQNIGPTAPRALLALLRAVQPLAAGKTASGVERSWRDLHETEELAPYLQAAFKRELILLRRPRDLDQVQRVSGRILAEHRSRAPLDGRSYLAALGADELVVTPPTPARAKPPEASAHKPRRKKTATQA